MGASLDEDGGELGGELAAHLERESGGERRGGESMCSAESGGAESVTARSTCSER